ncbi:endodeoxyribonuclease [Vibrio phage 1.177.O._10N.286.45.E10]|nr:endodeoxyribonuclease [Vibrio phage 1.177.O._10N.286.45.E10]
MSDYEFTMPWPPTMNHYHQPVRMEKGVRIIKGQKAKQYAKEMESYLESIGLMNEMIPEEQKLSVHITLNPPTLARYDVDNRSKGVLDALSNANFYADDSQIHSLTVIKGEKSPPGNVVVKVTKL